MTTVRALSITPAVASYLQGPRRSGVSLGHGYIAFSDYVIAVTLPGAPRMPNGIEADVTITTEQIMAGDGVLHIGDVVVHPGPVWLPRPAVNFTLSLEPHWQPDFGSLIGRGPGLTPLGDDILGGYLTGRTLTGSPVLDLPSYRDATTSLSRVLLDHARLGELPSPAHSLLTDGIPAELLNFGATSGRGLLVGLAAGMQSRNGPAAVTIDLELDGLPTFAVGIHQLGFRETTVGAHRSRT